jgi:hypothetical protein
MNAIVVGPKTVAAYNIRPRAMVIDFDDSLENRLSAICGAIKHTPIALTGPQKKFDAPVVIHIGERGY